MFSSKGFIVLGITFMSLIPFEFIFVYSVRQCFDFTVLHVNCPVYPEPLIEETAFSLLHIPAFCVTDELTTGMWIYFWTLFLVPLISVSVFVPEPYCSDYCSCVV